MTYEEFKKMSINQAREMLKGHDKEEVEKFLQSEEADNKLECEK